VDDGERRGTAAAGVRDGDRSLALVSTSDPGGQGLAPCGLMMMNDDNDHLTDPGGEEASALWSDDD